MANYGIMPQQVLLQMMDHQQNVSSSIEDLQNHKTFVDVTLVCDGRQLKAHKMVLSTSSPYFNSLLSSADERHPLILLPDVRYHEMTALLEFMYKGEISVDQDLFGSLLKVAKWISVKGLADEDYDLYQGSAPSTSKNHQTVDVLPKYLQPLLASLDSPSTTIKQMQSTSSDLLRETELKQNRESHNKLAKSEDVSQNLDIKVHSPFDEIEIKDEFEADLVDNMQEDSSDVLTEAKASSVLRSQQQISCKRRHQQSLSGSNSNSYSDGLVTHLRSTSTPPEPTIIIDTYDPNNHESESIASTDIEATQEKVISTIYSPSDFIQKMHTLSPSYKSVPYCHKRARTNNINSKQDYEALATKTTRSNFIEPKTMSDMSYNMKGLDLMNYAKILPDGKFRCLKCEERGFIMNYKNKHSLQQHAFLHHHSSAHKVYSCRFCKKEFNRPNRLKEHLKEVHDCNLKRDAEITPRQSSLQQINPIMASIYDPASSEGKLSL